jgi:hypothetical protein
VLLINLAQVAYGLPSGYLVSVLETEAGGSHVEGINVEETTTPSNKDDHLTPKGAAVLILPGGILWVLIDANAVHASKQQLGKTGLLQALGVGILHFVHL